MTVLTPTLDTPVLPGLLYAVWLAPDLSRGWFRCVYAAADGRTVDEVLVIGSDGAEASHAVMFPEKDLEWCLERLHADLYWAKHGERLYSDEPDLDALPPDAKQRALDQFAEDLEARREPRHRGVPLEPPPNEPAPDGHRWEWVDD